MDSMGWTMAFKISQSSKIPAFLAMQIMDQANQMQAAGCDLVHLEVGQPSSSPPSAVCKALEASLGRVASHSYSVAMGNPALRQRIASHYQDWYQICLLYTSPSPRDYAASRMPSSA